MAFQWASPVTIAVNQACAVALFVSHSWSRMMSGLVTSKIRTKGPGFFSGEFFMTLKERMRTAPAGLAGGSTSSWELGPLGGGRVNDSGSDQPTTFPFSIRTNMPRAWPELERSLASVGA